MAVNFLHGIESIEVSDGHRSVRAVKSGVIGLIGTAPIHRVLAANRTVNDMVTVLDRRSGVIRFGPDRVGFTIPSALAAIYDQGGAEVIVINVFDPDVHKTVVAEESITLVDGVATLDHPEVLAVASVKSSDGNTTYVLNTDYTWTVNGVITRVGTAFAADATLKVAYTYADPSLVDSADIIGGVDIETEQYTGLQLYETAFGRLGLFPKILIAPVYCEARAVSSQMEAMAENIRAYALIDAPAGLLVQQAIEKRGAAADAFNTQSRRMVLCYPRVKVYDTLTDGTRDEPYSPRLAGVISRVDKAEGYWVSPSNHPMLAILGPERYLTARLNSAETDVNRLNEAAICTLFNSFGTGYLVWGNRSAAWPNETHPKNFIPVGRTADIIMDSMDLAMLQYLDRPITRALIDAILETGNGFMRTLIGRGGLVDGKMWWNETDNPVEEIALGHLTFAFDLMPPPPLERVTFEYSMDINLLAALYNT